MGRPQIPFAWLTETETATGETVLTGKLGRAELIGRLVERDDGLRLWAIAITEPEASAKARSQYARRKREKRAELTGAACANEMDKRRSG